MITYSDKVQFAMNYVIFGRDLFQQYGILAMPNKEFCATIFEEILRTYPFRYQKGGIATSMPSETLHSTIDSYQCFCWGEG